MESQQPDIMSPRHQWAAGLITTLCIGTLVLSNWRDRARIHRPVNIERVSDAKAIGFCVDPNSAGWPELTTLPEISGTMARRIVEHRDQIGGFSKPEDVMQVRGIGPRTYARIQPYLRFHAALGDAP